MPAEGSAEFVRDFLRDVQLMVHGGVPTQEQAEAAEARKDPEWIPPEWTPEREPRTKRGRRRAAAAPSAPVVRPPTVPRRRRATAKRSRHLVRYSLVVVLIGACAAVPWVAPDVPRWIASALPSGSPTTTVADPTILPAPTPTAAPGTPAPVPTLTNAQLASAGRPLEVWVPRLKVRSPVVPISGQSGVLDPPADAQVLGWWQEGSGAGAENGSTVVTGHTVSTGGGAFDNLGQLSTGDRLRVRTDAGWITYAVDSTRDYSRAELAREAADIFALDGASRLVLITCSDFDGTVYLSNAVVFATPVGDEPFEAAVSAVDEVPDGGLSQPWDAGTGNTGDAPGVQLTEKPF